MSDSHLSRRDILVGAAAVGLATTLRGTALAEEDTKPNEPGPYDLVITGGRVVDPETGLDDQRHVGVKGGRIAAISRTELQGAKTLDAKGHVVAPGFIDLHAHGQQLPAAWMQAFDGVTTALELESGLLPISEYYKKTEAEGRPINFGAGAAWTYARIMVKANGIAPADGTLAWFQKAFSSKDWQNSLATAEEVEKIISLVEEGLNEGGLGVSINAGYAPGYGHKEYYALAKLAKKHGVATFTHVRFLSVIEPKSSFEALQEQISLAALTGAHMHVCHLNSTAMRDAKACVALVREAQQRGLPVTVEAYPYAAASTAIGAEALRGDEWMDRGGVKDASAVELDGKPLTQAKIDELQKSSPGDIVVIHFLQPDTNKEDQALLDESVLYPGGAIASDAMPWVDKDGKFIEGDVWPLPDGAFAHPRSCGTFSRFFGKYVRERKAISLLEAVRKTSLIPAQVIEGFVPQMKKKGRVQVGTDADLTVFDLKRIAARATYAKPAQTSVGHTHVIVGGVPIIENEKRNTAKLPGRPVRRAV